MNSHPTDRPTGNPTGDPTGRPTLPVERLSVLSLRHLSEETQRKLAHDLLSVNAYPLACGGLVYVGQPVYRRPAEPDLAALFEAAELANVSWLMFDRDVGPIDGLAVYTDAGPWD